jgi:hypothetical protein
MNLRTLVPATLTAFALAACSGGGSGTSSGTSSNGTLPQAGAPATFTLTVLPNSAQGASLARRPDFISAGVAQASFFIDGTEATRKSCTSGSCTYTFTTTAGSHTFTVAADDNGTGCTGSKACILAAGSTGSVSVAAGSGNGNNQILTLNGVAYGVAFHAGTCTSGNTNNCSGTGSSNGYAVTDFTSANITSAPSGASTAFDNGPLTLDASDTGVGHLYSTGTTAISLVPGANGNDYSWKTVCVGDTGTFTLVATSSTGKSTSATLSSITLDAATVYPSAFSITTFTFTCSATAHISESGSGTITVQSALHAI